MAVCAVKYQHKKIKENEIKVFIFTGAPLQPGLSLAGYGGQQQLVLGQDQSGLGHGGLVPSYSGLASLSSLHQNGVTNNNSTLAYLTSTGQPPLRCPFLTNQMCFVTSCMQLMHQSIAICPLV